MCLRSQLFICCVHLTLSIPDQLGEPKGAKMCWRCGTKTKMELSAAKFRSYPTILIVHHLDASTLVTLTPNDVHACEGLGLSVEQAIGIKDIPYVYCDTVMSKGNHFWSLISDGCNFWLLGIGLGVSCCSTETREYRLGRFEQETGSVPIVHYFCRTVSLMLERAIRSEEKATLLSSFPRPLSTLYDRARALHRESQAS
jgi:hypothetical protein